MKPGESSIKKPKKAKKVTKAEAFTYTFEELMSIMDDEVGNDKTPASPIDWASLTDDDPDDEGNDEAEENGYATILQ
jgi:hypothetical protein